MTFTISKWETFEHPEKSRRPKGAMTWHSHPCDMNSKGALRLLRLGDEGFRAMVVFERLVQFHSSRPIERRNGRLEHSDGSPMDLDDLADATRIEPQLIEAALLTLCDERIGWMSHEQKGTGSVRIRTSLEQNSALQDRTGQDSIKDASHPLSDSAEPEPNDDERGLETDIVQGWNHHREIHGLRWPKAVKLSPTTAKALRARRIAATSRDDFRDTFVEILARMRASPHYRGENDREWMPSLPWLLKATSWEKAQNLPAPEDLDRPRQTTTRKKTLTPLEAELRDISGGAIYGHHDSTGQGYQGGNLGHTETDGGFFPRVGAAHQSR